MRGRGLLLGVLLALGGGLASGCTSPRDVLGPSESPCYRAVAVARVALRHRGELTGVRQLGGGTFVRALREPGLAPGALPGVPGRRGGGLCLVAYRGAFSRREVERPLALGTGADRYAVVVVRERDAEVLATILLERRPARLSRVLPSL